MFLQIFDIFYIYISNNNNQLILPDTYRSSKLQLQNYARKNDHDPRVLTVKTEGIPHDIHYKANVVIDGKSFENPTLFNTIKEAEQAAAKIVDIFQQASVIIISYVIYSKFTFFLYVWIFYDHQIHN
jgi:dsRNA-specific ribonuclease